MVYIYILLCKYDKIYVGKTKTPYKRLNEHFHGNGSMWTKQFPPVEILQVIPDCDDYDEDKYTKKYMSKYGIDNVRGGSYTTQVLSVTARQHLQREIYGSDDICYNCQKKGHFAKDCNEIKQCLMIEANSICENESDKIKIDDGNMTQTMSISNTNINTTTIIKAEPNSMFTLYCLRCGEYGHTQTENKCNEKVKQGVNDLLRNKNFILNRMEKIIQNEHKIRNKVRNVYEPICIYCEKKFSKNKYMYYHCLYTCNYSKYFKELLIKTNVIIT